MIIEEEGSGAIESASEYSGVWTGDEELVYLEKRNLSRSLLGIVALWNMVLGLKGSSQNHFRRHRGSEVL
ncbi:hypothetical protein BpHYR1_036712 [Brachionus plicatilis]|uniref:Uncharacterized protein n=1 Tax=Brachionus plicatilis TaxID=10195 RepID=A0A3M7QYQ2_BRAPC|nr:hypothetical protein BpHYR1_036712 [Brachionus plicatilis]